MKKEISTRAQLGITQEDFAMLLRVPRTQLSMFESGLRSLPVYANSKFVEILTLAAKPKSIFKATKADEENQEQKMKKILAKQLLVNKHRQLMVQRKIERVQNNYKANMAAFQLFTDLETQSTSKEEINLLAVLKLKALKAIEKNGLHVQLQYQIKQEVLQKEAKILQKHSQKVL